ncbi:MAG: hypothetical protein ACREQ7_01175 [Candidatus Binatia bacterium]
MARQTSLTVLAYAFVPRIDVVTAESHVSFRYTIIAHQQDYTGYTNDPINQTDGFVPDGYRQVAPTFKVESLILLVYCPRNTLIKQHKGTADRGDVNREIGAIEDQYLSVKDRIGWRRCGIAHRTH